MKAFLKRRLELKISVLRAEGTRLDHERELLRHNYIHARGSGDHEAADDLAVRIRSLTTRYDDVCAQIRTLMDKRYRKELA